MFNRITFLLVIVSSLSCSAIGIGFNGAETNCGNCTHFRHPNDEQWRHVDIYFLATRKICSLSTLNCKFNRCAVCFQSSMNIACRSYLFVARIKRFSSLHIVIKPLNKNKTINYLCRSITLLMFTANLALVKSENWLAV